MLQDRGRDGHAKKNEPTRDEERAEERAEERDEDRDEERDEEVTSNETAEGQHSPAGGTSGHRNTTCGVRPVK